jgi:hypothetical protein
MLIFLNCYFYLKWRVFPVAYFGSPTPLAFLMN